MPATPLTDESRAVASRIRAWSQVGGNAQVLVGMAAHDADTLNDLHSALADLAGPAAPPALLASVDAAHEHAHNVEALTGNLNLLPLFVADADVIEQGAAFLDDWQPDPPPPEPEPA